MCVGKLVIAHRTYVYNPCQLRFTATAPQCSQSPSQRLDGAKLSRAGAKQPSQLARWGWAEWGWVVTTATVVQSQTTNIYIHIQVVIDRLLPPNLLTALFEVTSSIPVVQALTGLNNVILEPISSVRYQDF
jgi:hypothetical protein